MTRILISLTSSLSGLFCALSAALWIGPGLRADEKHLISEWGQVGESKEGTEMGGRPPGTFWLQASSRPQTLTLTYVDADKKQQTLELEHRDDLVKIAGQDGPYRGLTQLVEELAQEGRLLLFSQAFMKDLLSSMAYMEEASKKTVEEKLKKTPEGTFLIRTEGPFPGKVIITRINRRYRPETLGPYPVQGRKLIVKGQALTLEEFLKERSDTLKTPFFAREHLSLKSEVMDLMNSPVERDCRMESEEYAQPPMTPEERSKENSHVLFPGAFRPPHKGHFEMVRNYLKKETNHATIIMMGLGRRHGVSAQTAQSIWKKYYLPLYQKEFPQAKVEVIVSSYDPHHRAVDLLQQIPQENVVIIAGEDRTSYQKEMEGVISTSKKVDQKVQYQISERIDQLSATEFTHCLQKLSPELCLSFLPDDLEEAQKLEIINDLKKEILSAH